MRKIAIAGAGPAGLRTAEELRRTGYEGDLVLLGREQHLPYYRQRSTAAHASYRRHPSYALTQQRKPFTISDSKRPRLLV